MSIRIRVKAGRPKRLQEEAGAEAAAPDRSPAFSVGGAGEERRRSGPHVEAKSPEMTPHESEGNQDLQKSPLEPDEFDTLKAMVREYKTHGIDFSRLPRRPRFKRPRRNSGITCSVEIRDRALAKAKADPDGTGGNLSTLIEMLLWKYIGCPEDVVERPPDNPTEG